MGRQYNGSMVSKMQGNKINQYIIIIDHKPLGIRNYLFAFNINESKKK